jgi:hypothetical protein
VAPQRKALLVATYGYQDPGLRRLAAPAHDAEALADVLRDPDVAGFDVTVLLDEPAHVVGEAIGDFYGGCRRDDLTLLYFSGHGLKDDDGRLYLAMTNTRRDALLFTGLPAASISDAMDGCPSRRKVLVLDCCYSGAFPAGWTAKADPAVHTLERFQGRGRAVLTASDATSYSFEGDELSGSGSRSVFTRYLVEAMRSGAADLDADGDITLDELYSWVRDRVVAEMPQQRPKKQEDVEGRIVIARNVAWELPRHLRYAIDSPIAAQRLSALDGLGDLHRRGNDVVRAAVEEEIARLADDDSRSVSSAAEATLAMLPGGDAGAPERPVPPPSGVATPATTTAVPPRPEPPVGAEAPPAAAVTDPPSGQPPRHCAGRNGPGERPRTAARALLGLVLLSAVPLGLSRVLPFEAPSAQTADEFAETTVPWLLGVVLPLAAAAVLLVLSERLARAAPTALGLMLGAGLVLTEQVLFWVAFFVDHRDSYVLGPAFWSLVAGWAVVGVAGVLALTGSSLAARVSVSRDWRTLCALVVVVCVGVSVVAQPEAADVWGWLQLNAGVVILGPAALAVAGLRLREDQRGAALVALGVLVVWTLYFPLRELAAPTLGIEPAVWVVEIVTVVLIAAACCTAQLGPRRAVPDLDGSAAAPR